MTGTIHSRGSRRSARRAGAIGLGAASLGVLAAGLVFAVDAAQAAFVEVPATGAPGRLVLASDPYPAQFLALAPGDPGYWSVSARLEDASEATLALELRKSGEIVEHPSGLRMSVEACPERWHDLDKTPVCPGDSRHIALATPADDFATSSPVFDLSPLTEDSPVFLLVTLAVDAASGADASLMGLYGDVALGLTAVAIDDVAVPSAPVLPATGMDLHAGLAVATIAAGMLGLGLAFRLFRRREPE